MVPKNSRIGGVGGGGRGESKGRGVFKGRPGEEERKRNCINKTKKRKNVF
jgi:hypothetical protein